MYLFLSSDQYQSCHFFQYLGVGYHKVMLWNFMWDFSEVRTLLSVIKFLFTETDIKSSVTRCPTSTKPGNMWVKFAEVGLKTHKLVHCCLTYSRFHGPIGVGLKESYEYDHRAGAPLLWRQAHRIGAVQPIEEKVLEELTAPSSASSTSRGYKKAREGLFM